MVRDANEWKRAWRELVDTLPPPAANFRDSIVVIAATKEFGSGPLQLEFVDVRQCQPDGVIFAFLRLRVTGPRNDYGDRSVRAIELSRTLVGGHDVRFVRPDFNGP